MPIHRDQTFLGVVKANIRVSQLTSLMNKPPFLSNPPKLIRSSGEIIPMEDRSYSNPLDHLQKLSEQEIATLSGTEVTSALLKLNGVTYRFNAAPIPTTWNQQAGIVFGGKKGGIDQYKGNDSSGWYLVREVVPQNFFSRWLEAIQSNFDIVLTLILLFLNVLLWMRNRLLSKVALQSAKLQTHIAQENEKEIGANATSTSLQIVESKYDVLSQLEHTVQSVFGHTEALQKKMALANQKLVECRKELATLELLSGNHFIGDLGHYFQGELKRFCAHSNRHGHPLSLVLMELDYFDTLKTQLGEEKTQHLIEEVLKKIRVEIRIDDIVSTFSEGQFALLLPTTNKQTAIELSHRVQQEIANLVFDDALKITLSIGITEYIQGNQVEQFVSRANNALFRAKDNGTNQIFDS